MYALRLNSLSLLYARLSPIDKSSGIEEKSTQGNDDVRTSCAPTQTHWRKAQALLPNLEVPPGPSSLDQPSSFDLLSGVLFCMPLILLELGYAE